MASTHIRTVAYLPSGTLVASGSNDQAIRIWGVQNGTPFEGRTHWIRLVVFSPDRQCIISCSDDRTIRVWDVRGRTLINATFEGHTSRAMSLALSHPTVHVHSLAPGMVLFVLGAWVAVQLLLVTFVVDTWEIAEDGLIKGKDSRLLFWVPPDVARILPTPFNPWVIGRHGPITVDYGNLLLGEEWQGCFVSK